jgi:hypothetical protein
MNVDFGIAGDGSALLASSGWSSSGLSSGETPRVHGAGVALAAQGTTRRLRISMRCRAGRQVALPTTSIEDGTAAGPGRCYALPATRGLREFGIGIILIRLKAPGLCSISLNGFLFTPSAMAIRPESQIMVRLLRGLELHGIVSEHPGKPFLLA